MEHSPHPNCHLRGNRGPGSLVSAEAVQQRTGEHCLRRQSGCFAHGNFFPRRRSPSSRLLCRTNQHCPGLQCSSFGMGRGHGVSASLIRRDSKGETAGVASRGLCLVGIPRFQHVSIRRRKTLAQFYHVILNLGVNEHPLGHTYLPLARLRSRPVVTKFTKMSRRHRQSAFSERRVLSGNCDQTQHREADFSGRSLPVCPRGLRTVITHSAPIVSGSRPAPQHPASAPPGSLRPDSDLPSHFSSSRLRLFRRQDAAPACHSPLIPPP